MDNQKPNLWQLDMSSYEHTQWWTDFFGWIAVYDKHVLDVPSTLMRTLKYLTAQYTFEEDVGYTLPPSQVDEWIVLINNWRVHVVNC